MLRDETFTGTIGTTVPESTPSFEVLAHHLGAQYQKRFEIGFGDGPEAPIHAHGPVSRCD